MGPQGIVGPPSIKGTPGSKEPANFFKGTIPETTYAHPNVGDQTKTYWVSKEAKMRAAQEARTRPRRGTLGELLERLNNQQ